MKISYDTMGAGLGLALLFSCAVSAAELPPFSVSSGVPLLQGRVSTGAVVGRGGNFSVRAPGGTLWLLNNVWMGEEKEDGQRAVWGIIDGAAAFSDSTAPYSQAGAAYVADENGWPLPLLSGDLKEYSQARKFWPRSGACDGNRCFVFYSIMNNFGPEPYDFFRVGQGVASAAKPAGPYAKARVSGRYSFWNDIEPAFGSALLAGGDGWVYVYGRAVTAPGEYPVKLARARFENLDSRDKYSYYSQETASGAWTADLAEASQVLEGLPEEFSVSYNEALEAYLAVYSDPESGSAMATTAPFPWGPWSPPSPLLTCAREDYCFGAKEQPAFAAGGGRTVYLTVEKKNVPYLYEVNFKPGE